MHGLRRKKGRRNENNNMSIFGNSPVPDLSKLGQQSEICTRCKGAGYIPVTGVSTEIPGVSQVGYMFCTNCQQGKTLRTIMNEARLSDLKSVLVGIRPKIGDARSKLHQPDEAKKVLDSLESEVSDTITKIENAMNAGKV